MKVVIPPMVGGRGPKIKIFFLALQWLGWLKEDEAMVLKLFHSLMRNRL